MSPVGSPAFLQVWLQASGTGFPGSRSVPFGSYRARYAYGYQAWGTFLLSLTTIKNACSILPYPRCNGQPKLSGGIAEPGYNSGSACLHLQYQRTASYRAFSLGQLVSLHRCNFDARIYEAC